MTDDGSVFSYSSIWRKHFTPPSEQFVEDEEEFIQHSFVFKSFRTEFELDHAFNSSGIKLLKKLKSDDNKLVTSQPAIKSFDILDSIPGYSPFSKIQKKSVLSTIEMKECFDLFLASLNGPLTTKQLEKYNMYRDRITAEQSDYLMCARQNWFKCNFKRHSEIKPEVLQEVNSLWKEEISRISKYPVYYSQVNLISLVYQCTNLVEMNFLKVLKLMGKSRPIFEPTLKFYVINLHSALPHINCAIERNLKLPCYTNAHEVSEDQIADELARENSVNIVLSSSSFVALLSNHYPNFYSSWDIPITIKEHTTESGTKRTIVFIDRPLPVKSMTLCERNKWFCRIGCEYVLVHKYKEPRPSVKNHQPNIPETNNFEIDSSEGEEEEEGNNGEVEKNIKIDSCDESSYNNTTCLKKQHSQNSDPAVGSSEKHISFADEDIYVGESDGSSSDDGGLVIADESQEDVNPPIESEKVISSKSPDIVVPSTQNFIQKKKKKNCKRKKRSSQVSYRLWSLKKSSQVILSKTCSKDLTLLIRCNEGYFKYPSVKNDQDVKWIVSSKLEYQTEFGAEAMTLDELSYEWGNLYIRPNTKLLRARVNPSNGEIIMFEKKTLSDLGNECLKLHKVNMMSKLASVYSVMEKLADQPPGRYHLSHMSKNGAFVPLYRECAGSNGFNLQMAYNINVEDVAPERSPWIPIDVSTITPTFMFFRRVPAMFIPYKPSLKKKSQGSAQKQAKRKNARVKGKNKAGKNIAARRKKNKSKLVKAKKKGPL